MTGQWSIIVPEARTNLVKNPSVETNTTGHAATGSTISRDSAYARAGVFSLKIVTDDAGASEGTVYNGGGGTGAMPVTIGTSYTASVFLRGDGTVYLGIYWYTTSGSVFVSTSFSSVLTLADSGWTRYTITATAPATSDYAQIRVITSAQQSARFWCDGFQFEAGAYATTYIDGDRHGCYWTGLYHASTSARHANYRLGGRVVDIEDTYGIRVLNSSGAGAPTVDVMTQALALQPGSTYINDVYRERTLNLVLAPYSATLPGLHLLRKNLWNLIKPEAYGENDPFLLAYTGNTRKVYGAFRYDGGWDFGQLSGGAYKVEQQAKVSLRLVACDPYWYEDDQQQETLEFTDSLASNNYAAARINGNWQNLGTGFNGQVNCIVPDTNTGRVYFGGAFTTANGVTVNGVCYWNGETFVAMTGAGGTGVSGGAVNALAVAPNNDVWIGGAFTSCDGATADGLARWNYAASTYTKFTNGAPGDIFNAIAIDKNGIVYLGGLFANWDANANSDNIVSYNGTAFAPLSTGTNGQIYSLATGIDGSTLYVGGAFSSPQTRVMSWNGSAFSAMGGGASSIVRSILAAINGDVYICGDFATTPTTSYIARWSGSSWYSLGSGLSLSGYKLFPDQDGRVVVVGPFSTAGGITAYGIAAWNLSVWSGIDLTPPGAAEVICGASAGESMYLGFDTAGTATSSGLATLINNSTSDVYPIITITGPTTGSATLQWLENQTTGDLLYLNLVILPGEIVTIDLRPGAKSVNSSWRGASTTSNRGTVYFTSGARGQIYDAVLPGSDFSNWHIAPGSNTIAAFVSGTTTGVVMVASWQTQHNTVDGASA
jgi:hypothetical protein